MRFLFLVLIALFGSTAPVSAQNYDVIVAFGQSNSTQNARGPYFDQLQTPGIDSRIKTLGRHSDHEFGIIPAIQTINGKTVECLESWGRNPCSENTETHSFIVPFARRYVRHVLAPGREVMIISAGRGGASILEWNGKLIRPDFPEGPLLYSDMVGRLRHLLSIRGNRLVSFHLSQGETDVAFAESGDHGMTPAKFEAELRELLEGLIDQFPQASMIATKFAPAWRPDSLLKVLFERAIGRVLRELGGASISTVGLASQEGESVHFSAQSSVTLGIRHFNAWQNLNR